MGNIGRIRGLDDEGSRDALRELDRRRPLLDLGLVRDNSDRPSAEAHTGRLVYTQGKLGIAGTLFYSDGTEWRDVIAGETSFVAPDLTLGTSNAAGSGSSVLHHNATIALFDATAPKPLESAAVHGSTNFAADAGHVHEFPETLQSDANSSTLTLTDNGSNQTLTGDLGRLHLRPAAGSAGAVVIGPGNISSLADTNYARLGVGALPIASNAVTVSAASSAGQTTATGLNFFVQSGVASANAVTGIFGQAFNLSGNNQKCIGMFSFLLIGGNHGTSITRDHVAHRVQFQDLAGSGDYDKVIGIEILNVMAASSSRVFGRLVGLDQSDSIGEAIGLSGSTATTLLGAEFGDRVLVSSSNAEEKDVLTLNQLAVDAGDDGAHIFFNDKTTDPGTPVAGQLWRNADLLNYEQSAGTVPLIPTLVSKSGAYTATDADYSIICDASGGAFTITLPAASGRVGRRYHVKKVDSSGNAVTIDGNASETIDGATTLAISTQYDSIMITTDGSNWHII